MSDKIWMKRVCIPLWVIQLLICLLYAGVSAVGLWAVDEVQDEGRYTQDKYNDAIHALNVRAAVSLALSVFTIVLVIVEIILSAIHKLKPVANIVFQVIKSLIWTAWFILTIVTIATGGASGLSIFLALVLFLSCISMLIYGSIILHRHRKGTLNRGAYSPATAETSYGQSGFAYGGPPAPAGRYTAYNNQPKPTGYSGDYYGNNGAYEMHGNNARY